MGSLESFIDLIRLVYKPEHADAHQRTKQKDKIEPFVVELEL